MMVNFSPKTVHYGHNTTLVSQVSFASVLKCSFKLRQTFAAEGEAVAAL